MAPTVLCCREKPLRAITPFNLVNSLFQGFWYKLICTAVLMMAETCLLAEAAICYPPLFDDIRSIQPRPTETAETVAIAAVAAASEQGASAIIVLSTSGHTPRLISKYRPSVPIITGRHLHMESSKLQA
jgi:pyruvate kinase